MANKRTPQTLKKRQRERDKQMKRLDKIARRIERNSKKREAKAERSAGVPPTDSQVAQQPVPVPEAS
jgi:hypothetical protein